MTPFKFVLLLLGYNVDVGHWVWHGGWQDGDPQHDSIQISPSQDVQSRSGKVHSGQDSHLNKILEVISTQPH